MWCKSERLKNSFYPSPILYASPEEPALPPGSIADLSPSISTLPKLAKKRRVMNSRARAKRGRSYADETRAPLNRQPVSARRACKGETHNRDRSASTCENLWRNCRFRQSSGDGVFMPLPNPA